MSATHPAEAAPMTDSPALNYAAYLRLDEVLNAQSPRSAGPDGPEHDEMLFIIIHQVYELWFKQLLHELDYLQTRLTADDLPRALGTLRRILTILKTVVAQIDVLETMTPLQFLAFRDFLESGSGFQSAQFREMEFALGHKRRAILNHFADDAPAHARLAARYAAPTLWDAFLHLLHHRGYAVPAALLSRDLAQPITASPELQATLIAIYRGDPDLARLCERLIDLDEGLQEWRYRHVKMVERTIGVKPGTGGSAGSAYLRTTLSPLFPDLWAIRTAF
jgi:tryptophan 2,3-dioxygenase